MAASMTHSPRLFDTHAHVLSADVQRYPHSTLRGGVRPPVAPVVFTVGHLIAAMDEAGVDSACVVQRATLYGYDNRYALDAAAAHSARLVPVVVLDAQDPASPQRLRGLAAAHRLGGLRLVAPTLSATDTGWLDGETALGLWRMAADLALPVSVILYRINNAAGCDALLRIARRWRAMPILIDHAGVPHGSTPEIRHAASQGIHYVVPPGPDYGMQQSIARFADLGHVHLKVTDINFDRLEEAGLDSAPFVRALADRFGAERLLWGSDVGQSPAPYAHKLQRVLASAMRLAPAERAGYLGGTASRIYGRALA